MEPMTPFQFALLVKRMGWVQVTWLYWYDPPANGGTYTLRVV